ncbi:MAG: PEP/pyruvate-binding domain-containing protein, partial [Gemmatimonadota bacterium]|nr:PEP/pyruvate-binding domain-containing protein [Gemmatimonadota bacterium]
MRSSEASLPPDLYAEIEAAYAELGARCGTPEPAVAIRSSATAEDGAVNSFAGQYQTLLNVVGMDAVAAAIVECVEAAYRPHAAAYRKRSGVSADEVNLAILVQEFIAADSSAVAFTANPVTNDSSEIVINAYWGLGEGLVDGSSVPDTYTVDKRELRIKTRSVAKKERMCAAGSAGVIEIDVPADNRSRSTLTDEQVGEVCRSAVDLETRMGWPVDLECAFKEGKLYLLQCRPVTTLAQDGRDWSVEWDDPKDAELTWRRGNLEAPLDQSFEWYWMQGWAKARRETGGGTLPMRIYVNGYAYEAEKPFRVGNRKAQEDARKKTEREIPELWKSEWLPGLKQKRAYFRSLDLSALSNDELASVLVEALPWYCECARMHAHLGGTAVEA